MAKLFLTSSLSKRVERSPALKRFIWLLEASILGVLWWVLGRLSPDRASAVGRRLLGLFGPHHDKNRIIKGNLALAFPDLSPTEIETLAREVWANLGALLSEYPHLETICVQEADERLEIVVSEEVEVLRQSGKQVVFVTAHLGNWEVSAAAGAKLGFPMMVVYTPLQNPWMDRLLARMRRPLGVKLVTRDGALRPLVQHMRQGGSVGLLVDQRVDAGEPLPFFGLDMWTSLMPARLALKFGCPLVPARVERLNGARFRVTIYRPIQPDGEITDEQEQALAMTRQVNALFEGWIREQPDQWLCSKRRWPKRLIPTWTR